MTMQKLDDGSQLMAAQTVLATSRGNGTWRYSYRALETWKGGRLQKFEAHSDEDGKKRHVVAALQDRALRVNVNDHRHEVSGEAWTNSFWFLPTVAQRTQYITLFDIDTGKESTGTLEHLGPERRTVNGADVDCFHHRVKAGSLVADLWYDGADRLIRRESNWDGHKLVLELTKVQK